MSDWPDRPTSAEDELETVREDLAHLRKELTVSRIAAFGLLGVLVLSHVGASRLLVGGAGGALLLVLTFLSCRWGIGDIEFSLGQSIGVTLSVAVFWLLLPWWRFA